MKPAFLLVLFSLLMKLSYAENPKASVPFNPPSGSDSSWYITVGLIIFFIAGLAVLLWKKHKQDTILKPKGPGIKGTIIIDNTKK
jgi:LPXTG-motif cell wall-anchored protein